MPSPIRLLALVTAWALLGIAHAAAAPVMPQPGDATLEDAQLTDVCFSDAEHGWAVGDRGVIWHTADGGRNWQRQTSGVECRLSSVFFLDDKIGWAAGGQTQPYTQASQGVVLRTRDGGQHWTADLKIMLPSVERIGFFDAAHGWALGQSTAYFPSGVYATEDGGRSWAALPGAENRAWLAGELIDRQQGALAGRNGAVAVVRRRAAEASNDEFGLRALKAMKLAAPAGGWLVGDGGLVLRTQDLGKTWQVPDGELPGGLRHFDLAALAVRGSHCWIAGTPGTRVFHSGDGGQSWEAFETRQTLPIHALAFADERRGWAVGELGLILATEDGGKTWKRQRAGGGRAAYLGIYSRANELPLELIARLSADEGFLGAVEVLTREGVEQPTPGDPPRQTHQAAVAAGGSASETAWQFPLREAGLQLSGEQLVEDWNAATDGQAIAKLEAHLVSRIRMWRPNVVFTESANAREPLAHVVNQLVLRAVERAADPARYAEQTSEAGLAAWKVHKVYGSLAGGQGGTSNINTAQVAPRLGRSIGELASAARGVIAPQFAPPPANVGFRLLIDHLPQGVGQRDFFSGIPLSPGSEARRAYSEVGDFTLDTARREAQMRRNLQAILARAESDPRDGHFLASIGEQTKTMEPGRAAEVVYQLAHRYHRQGRWELAAECFDLIVERYPAHPLAGSSLIWLVQYYASGEASWRLRSAEQHTIQQVSARDAAADGEAELDPAAGEVQQAGGAAARIERGGGLVLGSRANQERLERASGYAKQLEGLQPMLYAEPHVRFPLAVAHRGLGLPRQAERYFVSLRHSRPEDAWLQCALGELWLAEPKPQMPKPVWNCVRAPLKPRLDGKLDEPFWKGDSAVALKSPLGDDDEWGTEAMLAYDEEFLYLGIRCSRAEGFKYVNSSEPRPRDADLSQQDRVELLIDVDRDFATYYRLVVDHRGWTAESCWGDATWNPNWFVASGGDDESWTIEAAIPLAELTGQRAAAKHAWAVGLQRTVPGVGFQSWTAPAAIEARPEGFGYLMFQ